MTPKEQIELYCEQMNEEKALHKANKTLNDNIKQTLIDDNATDAKSGKYSVHLETRVTEELDTVKMLDILKAFWKKKYGSKKCPFIRTVEVLDMEELESFMYTEELPSDLILDLDMCRIKKETKALTYKIAKEK